MNAGMATIKPIGARINHSAGLRNAAADPRESFWGAMIVMHGLVYLNEVRTEHLDGTH